MDTVQSKKFHKICVSQFAVQGPLAQCLLLKSAKARWARWKSKGMFDSAFDLAQKAIKAMGMILEDPRLITEIGMLTNSVFNRALWTQQARQDGEDVDAPPAVVHNLMQDRLGNTDSTRF